MLTESAAPMVNSSGDCAASGPCVPAVHAAAGVAAAHPTVTPVRLFEMKSSRMRPAPPFPAPLAPSNPAAPGSPNVMLPAATHMLPPAPPALLPPVTPFAWIRPTQVVPDADCSESDFA